MAWQPCPCGDPQCDDVADTSRLCRCCNIECPGCDAATTLLQRGAVEYVVDALRGFCGFDNVIDDIEDDESLEDFLTELSDACPRLRLEGE